jgi:RND family efflux transporter MFP subunit
MLLPGVAAVGLVIAILVAVQARTELPRSAAVAKPGEAPFASYIGGAGMVEASTDNISIGTAEPGIVKTVSVKVGDKVAAGQTLFDIDDREKRADQRIKQANLNKAKAAVDEATASLEDSRAQYELVRSVTDPRAVSVDDVQKRRNAQALAEAKLESARAAVTVTEAELASAESAVQRLTVRAPVAGKVLQVNVHPGEYAQTGILSTPLMRLGASDLLHIRVDIDENDGWRFKPGARGVAYLRGNKDLKADLAFVRVEPYVTPKASLTGSSTERVDTRVLQVIYRFDPTRLPAYVGQQVDVFIEAPLVNSTAEGTTATRPRSRPSARNPTKP